MKDIQKQLAEFVQKYNLKEEAIKLCRIAMTNCVEEDIVGLRGFRIEEIRLEFVRHELVFEHYFYNTPFIKTRIGLYKKKENEAWIRNLEPIGSYDLWTNLNGDAIDDFLIVDAEKD